MRNGGSSRPKCSRYSDTLFLVCRAHPAVERRAVDAEELGRLADVAARQAQGRLDVAAFPGPERLVKVEAGRAFELAQRLLGDRRRPLRVRRDCRRLEIELRLELGPREPLPRVLGGEANHDIA